jgi:tRNA(Ile)-lysidine synthase
LAAAPRALRLRRFKAVLEALGPGQPLMRNLLNLDQAFLERRTGSTIQFPGGKIAEVTRHGVRFSRTPDSATYND